MAAAPPISADVASVAGLQRVKENHPLFIFATAAAAASQKKPTLVFVTSPDQGVVAYHGLLQKLQQSFNVLIVDTQDAITRYADIATVMVIAIELATKELWPGSAPVRLVCAGAASYSGLQFGTDMRMIEATLLLCPLPPLPQLRQPKAAEQYIPGYVPGEVAPYCVPTNILSVLSHQRHAQDQAMTQTAIKLLTLLDDASDPHLPILGSANVPLEAIDSNAIEFLLNPIQVLQGTPLEAEEEQLAASASH